MKTVLVLVMLAWSVLGVLSGCTSPKEILYFQDIDQVTPQKIDAEYQPVIMKDDKLQIIISGPDKSVVVPYNFTLYYNSSGNVTGSGSGASNIIPYLVD